MRYRTSQAITAVCAALLLGACTGSVNAPIEIPDGTQNASAAKTVNGVIRIGNDVSVTHGGDFRSVNGAATVGARSTVPGITLVNGSIRVGEDSRTGELATVNGSISVGPRTQVADGISTVNGAVLLSEDAEVVGGVTAVNGRITLAGATVVGDVGNANGGVQLLGPAVIDGNLTIRRPRGISPSDKPPLIVIGEQARVTGTLTFEREVDLRVHRDAQVGEIVGATPEWLEADPAGDDEHGG